MSQWIYEVTQFPNLSKANCISDSIDPDVFFPESNDELAETLPMLRQICGQCVEAAGCLKFALDNHVPYGVWAGTTPNQRRDIMGKEETVMGNRSKLYYIRALMRLGFSEARACEEAGIGERTLARLKQHEREATVRADKRKLGQS